MWYHAEGMPPVLPALDQTLAQASLALAQAWYDFDRNEHNTNTNDNNKQTTSGERVVLEGWSSGQITCFLDALESKTYEDDTPRPLHVATLTAMNAMYAFDTTKNAEILYRYCQLAIASEDTRILPTVIRFITSQGRMKYVRPLYKSLFKSDMGTYNSIVRVTLLICKWTPRTTVEYAAAVSYVYVGWLLYYYDYYYYHYYYLSL